MPELLALNSSIDFTTVLQSFNWKLNWFFCFPIHMAFSLFRTRFESYFLILYIFTTFTIVIISKIIVFFLSLYNGFVVVWQSLDMNPVSFVLSSPNILHENRLKDNGLSFPLFTTGTANNDDILKLSRMRIRKRRKRKMVRMKMMMAMKNYHKYNGTWINQKWLSPKKTKRNWKWKCFIFFVVNLAMNEKSQGSWYG